jgi:hypothetical protein
MCEDLEERIENDNCTIQHSDTKPTTMWRKWTFGMEHHEKGIKGLWIATTRKRTLDDFHKWNQTWHFLPKTIYIWLFRDESTEPFRVSKCFNLIFIFQKYLSWNFKVHIILTIWFKRFVKSRQMREWPFVKAFGETSTWIFLTCWRVFPIDCRDQLAQM